MVAVMNSFEVLMFHSAEHRAQLYREAETDRLVARALVGRASLRTRLAQALLHLAERLERARCLPAETCSPSHVRV